jgi:hypothetical protein
VFTLPLSPAIMDLDKLYHKLRDQLETEKIEKIDDVIYMIINLFEKEKNSST